MAQRHHQRRVATRSAQTLEASMSHDTTNHPAHQRHAAFTPACFTLPSGTVPHGLPTHWKQSYHTIPPIIPLTSDTSRLRQHVSRSPGARRHTNALSTKAAQIRVALRHHECRVAPRSAHTRSNPISHDTANHPAHQRHAAFTPACFVLPGGTAPGLKR